jgi:hypothetical protein
MPWLGLVCFANDMGTDADGSAPVCVTHERDEWDERVLKRRRLDDPLAIQVQAPAPATLDVKQKLPLLYTPCGQSASTMSVPRSSGCLYTLRIVTPHIVGMCVMDEYWQSNRASTRIYAMCLTMCSMYTCLPVCTAGCWLTQTDFVGLSACASWSNRSVRRSITALCFTRG